MSLHVRGKDRNGHLELLAHLLAGAIRVRKKLVAALIGGGTIDLSREILAHDLLDVGHHRLEDLIIAPELLLLARGLVEAGAEHDPIDETAEVGDTMRLEEFLALVVLAVDRRHGDMLDMIDQAVRVREFLLNLGRLTIRLDALADLMIGGHAPADHIPGLARDDAVRPLATLEIIELRVVDRTIQDVPGIPREGRLAGDTPHLIAPLRLEDAHLALGAVARILAEESDRINIVLGALVGRIPLESLIAVALGAEEMLAEPALVPGRDSATAIGPWAGEEEIGARHGLNLILATKNPVITILLPYHLQPGLLVDPPGLLVLLQGLLRPDLKRGALLVLPDLGLRLDQEGLGLVLLEILVHKGPAQFGAQELHIPLGLAGHAPRDDGILDEIPLHALLACRMPAIEALHLLAVRSVEFCDADGTLHFICQTRFPYVSFFIPTILHKLPHGNQF